MDTTTTEGFDSLDLQKIFDSLSDDKKIEFLKDLKGVVDASDEYLADIERVITETAKEFEEGNAPA